MKQSEAILDGVFLSSPILSFARKRKNGKKKRRALHVVFLPAREDADAALGPVSFLCLARKILERKNRFPSLKGFLAPSPRLIPTSNRNRPIFASGSTPYVVVGLGHISPLYPAASASSDADPNCKSPASLHIARWYAAHSARSGAPWAVVEPSCRRQLKIEAYALFLSHSSPVRTPVRNLVAPRKDPSPVCGLDSG